MKQGGDHKSGAGFTIVETLIVLAVTGALFISVVIMIGGKQARTEFQVGINGFRQQLQDVINQTASGYYPNSGGIACKATPTGPDLKNIAGSQQGSNGDCIFVGNVLVASVHTNDKLFVYPLVGDRLQASTTQESQSITDAIPTAISPTVAKPNVPDSSTTIQIPNGITFVSAGASSTSVTPLPTAFTTNDFAVGLVTSFGSYEAGNTGILNSGSQQFNLYGFCSPWAQYTDKYTFPTDINNAATPTVACPAPNAGYAPLRSAYMCFRSGGTNQSGLISIGGPAGGLAVNLQIKNGVAC